MDEERLARGCYALALFTEIFRAGPMPGSRLRTLPPKAGLDELLGLAHDEEVADLLAGWVLRRGQHPTLTHHRVSFYALDVGLGVETCSTSSSC